VRVSETCFGTGFFKPAWNLPKTYLNKWVNIYASKGGCAGNVRFQGESYSGLGDGSQQEGPGPFGIWDIHYRGATNGWRQLGGKALALVISARYGRCVGLGAVRLRSEVAIERLTSEEGCSRLVGRNFGGIAAASGRQSPVVTRKFKCHCWRCVVGHAAETGVRHLTCAWSCLGALGVAS
jgi:hypothetical protein